MCLLFSTSCKKEGCLDANATNYDSEVKKDDGSCTYEASAVFWIDAQTSGGLQNNWIDELKFYIDENYIGKMSTNSSLLIAPQCNSGGISHLENLGSNKSKLINYKVKYDQQSGPNTFTEEIIYEGSLNLIGGNCQSFQLQ